MSKNDIKIMVGKTAIPIGVLVTCSIVLWRVFMVAEEAHGADKRSCKNEVRIDKHEQVLSGIKENAAYSRANQEQILKALDRIENK